MRRQTYGLLSHLTPADISRQELLHPTFLIVFLVKFSFCCFSCTDICHLFGKLRLLYPTLVISDALIAQFTHAGAKLHCVVTETRLKAPRPRAGIETATR